MFKRYFSTLAVAALAGVAIVAGQDSDVSDVAEGIARTLLNFQGTRLIPNLLPESEFALRAVLNEEINDEDIEIGQLIEPETASEVPTWTLEYAEPQDFSGQLFTVITVDPRAATEEPQTIVRHYLANNVSLGDDNQLQNMTAPVAGWFMPAPPAGSGVHRYATLVFLQGDDFQVPEGESMRNETINLDFDLAGYIQEANLGPVVAATFFLSQNAEEESATTTTVPGLVETSTIDSSSVQALQTSISDSLAQATGTSAPEAEDQDQENAAAPSAAATFGVLALTACGALAGAILL